MKVGEAVYHSLSTLATSMISEISKIVQRYQPQILTHLHQIEALVYDFIVKMTGMDCNGLFMKIHTGVHELLD